MFGEHPLHQSRYCEIVVIDDVSTDNTLEVVARHQARDARIRLCVNDRNYGAMASENIAIYAARGKYIARMGDDDVTLPGNYTPQLAILKSSQKSASRTASGATLTSTIGLVVLSAGQDWSNTHTSAPGTNSSTYFRRIT